MSTNTNTGVVDPRADETSISEGQVFQDSRAESDPWVLEVIYADDQVVLCRSNRKQEQGEKNYHFFERREMFDKLVMSGRYQQGQHLDLKEVRGIGDGTAESLREIGVRTDLDVLNADDETMLDVDGMGTKKLERLREYARSYGSN